MDVRTWQADGNPMAMGIRWTDISPMVVRAQFTCIDLRTETAYSHQRSSTQTQQTNANPRVVYTRQTDDNLRVDTIQPNPQNLRRKRRTGDSLRAASTQRTGAHPRAMDRQRMDINPRDVARQQTNESLRVSSTHRRLSIKGLWIGNGRMLIRRLLLDSKWTKI